MTMLYYYLAESLSELDTLTALIEKLEVKETHPSDRIDISRLKQETGRIKRRASADVLIFGSQYSIYLTKNMTEINTLILRLLDILVNLPEVCCMDNREQYCYQHSVIIREELAGLSRFFDGLKKDLSDEY